MALSRRDWNNVIIYSVLAMLMLFYFVPQHLMSQRQQHLPSYKLVPEGYVLIQIQFDRTNLQQAGQVWRFQPVIDESIEPAVLADLWQKTELKPWPQQIELSPQPVRRVALLFAGENSLQQWGLYQNGPDFYLKKQGFIEIFQVTAKQAEQLIPASFSGVPEQSRP